jgi:hypothetical protein
MQGIVGGYENFPHARSETSQSHHANRLVRGLRSQSRELWTVSFAMSDYLVRPEPAPAPPERSAWIGGHGTEP